MHPLVTVLTTAYNAERHIAEAIESIQNQTFRDWEYILVDDASSDETARILERYASDDSRLRIVRREENGGPYVAANQGFAEARGRFVARLDADDVALPHRLERQIEFMSANPRLRACAAEIMILTNGELSALSGEFPILPGSLKWRLFFRTFMPSTTFVETAAWAEIGGFNELELSQDLRFWFDLSRRHWLGFIPEVLVYWRTHPEQLTARRNELQQALGLDAMRCHLSAMGADWSDADVDRLKSVGERSMGYREARRVIARWERSWRCDERLSDDERRELAKLKRRLLARQVRRETRQALESRSWGRQLLRLRGHVRRSSRS